MTGFRTKGRGRNRKVYPINPRRYRRRVTYSYEPPPELNEARDDLEELRMKEEKRMIERTLTQVGDIFLSSIFHLFSPLINTFTNLLLFGKEQIKDEEIIKTIDLIERELSAASSVLEKEHLNTREIVKAKRVAEAIHGAVKFVSKDREDYVKKFYKVFLKSYASEIIEQEYLVGRSVSRTEWRPERVITEVEQKIDQAVDCLAEELLARQGSIERDSDLNKIVEDLLRQCLESLRGVTS